MMQDGLRVNVSVAKSGSLKSGQRRAIPCAFKRSAKYPAFVDFADEANPCR